MEILFSRHMQIGVREYFCTRYQADVVLLALRNYGHLIRTVHRTEISFSGFADRIESSCDANIAQTKEVVRVLREVHQLNS